MKKELLRCFCFLLLLAAYVPSLSCADETLDAARREYAVHFFDVNAHVRLAKQLHDRGQRLAAFFVLETARREHFEQAEFTRAFRSLFLDDNFDNSRKAEDSLRTQLRLSPNDFEMSTKLADVYISRSDWAKAVPLLQLASKLRPEDFSTVAALANVYRGMNQDEKAETAISLWTKEHPVSVDAYHVHIFEQLGREDAAAARPVVDEALKRYPNDATLHFDLGIVLERSGDLEGTERELERAAQLGPKSASIQGWVARFFWKRKQDPRRALDLYLNAYFLDPDFYETEYAESRIPEIAQQVADLLMKEMGKNSLTKPGISADLMPLSPVVEEMSLDATKLDWAANSMDKVLEIMGSDDEHNRWNAMLLAAGHLNAISDERLSGLLEDPDLRKRGMAGYLAMQRWKEKALPLLKKWLDDPAELVRYDAISALVLHGDVAGRKIVEEYARSGKEPNARIREGVKNALSKSNDTKSQ
jgi:tetratricopeptide (TPR) repeat protein